MSGKRGLGKRFFGWIRPSGNDNFDIKQLTQAIYSERKNLEGRRLAVDKYERYALLYKNNPAIARNAKVMADIERTALPNIQLHIDYLEAELEEELRKERLN